MGMSKEFWIRFAWQE